MPTLGQFKFFRHIWGLKSKRDNPVRLQATVRMDGIETKMPLNEYGEPDGVKVIVEPDSAGKKNYSVFGSSERVEAKAQEIAGKCGPIEWTERAYAEIESLTTVEVEVVSLALRRLAAKVAFERFAQTRDNSVLTSPEFNPIREFILTGKEQEPCCGLLANLELLSGKLNVPIPNNAVFMIAYPSDRILGSFVTFFGLYFYWVILSRRYTALAPWDDFWFENPQRCETNNPVLRSGTGSLRVQWDRLISEYRDSPSQAVQIVSQYAIEKLRAAADEHYGRRQ